MKLFSTLKEISKGRIKLPIPDQQTEQIAEAAFANGEIIVRKYMEKIISVPIKTVLENIVDFMTELLMLFPSQAITWINSNLAEVPSSCLSDAEKEEFCKDFEYKKDSVYTIHKSFETLSRRAEQITLQGIS